MKRIANFAKTSLARTLNKTANNFRMSQLSTLQMFNLMPATMPSHSLPYLMFSKEEGDKKPIEKSSEGGDSKDPKKPEDEESDKEEDNKDKKDEPKGTSQAAEFLKFCQENLGMSLLAAFSTLWFVAAFINESSNKNMTMAVIS